MSAMTNFVAIGCSLALICGFMRALCLEPWILGARAHQLLYFHSELHLAISSKLTSEAIKSTATGFKPHGHHLKCFFSRPEIHATLST